MLKLLSMQGRPALLRSKNSRFAMVFARILYNNCHVSDSITLTDFKAHFI